MKKTKDESKKEKKKVDPEKREKDIGEILYKLAFIEQEQKEAAVSVINWVEKIVNKKQLKLVHTLIEWIFDIAKTPIEIKDYFHAIKLLLLINFDDTVDKLLKERDLGIRFIFYIRDTDAKELCQDVFFILDSIIKTPEELKEYYTQDFIIRLFDILDLIEDDLNYRAVIKILVQINAYFKSTESNLFMSIYRIHKNSRVLKEVIVRVLNDEKNRVKITQILNCLSNMMIVEKGNPYFFYINDLYSFLDIITVHLKFYYSEEMNVFALDAVEKLISFPDYFQDAYKVDDIREIVEDYIDKVDASDAIKAKAQKIKDILDNPESITDPENTVPKEDKPEEEIIKHETENKEEKKNIETENISKEAAPKEEGKDNTDLDAFLNSKLEDLKLNPNAKDKNERIFSEKNTPIPRKSSNADAKNEDPKDSK
ncbi:MAG: DUF2013 domain-containing protein [archaeon]|nr:DUF2013 domain-containing protein [archaeon]